MPVTKASHRLPLLALLVWSGLTACGRTSSKSGDPRGRIEAQWTGADTGRMTAAATAEWCEERRALEIAGLQGDTGLALVLYPVDSIKVGTYPIVQPEGADTLAPAAGIALRLFQRNTIQGYQGDSGNVLLEQAESGELSATVSARARSAVNGVRLIISGQARDLTVVPQRRGCGPDPEPDLPDTTAG
jgi:hypothetical protein